MENWNSVGSERGALVTSCKTAICAGFTWGRAKFQKGAGLSEKENSNIKEGWKPSVHHATYLKLLRRDRILCKSSVSWFPFIADGRMKKKNHVTRVLVVVVLTSKYNLQISSARITSIQSYLVSQVSPHCSYSFFTYFLKTFNLQCCLRVSRKGTQIVAWNQQKTQWSC